MSHTGAPDFWDNMICSGDPHAGYFDYWSGSDPSYECDEVTPEALYSPGGFFPQIPLHISPPEAEAPSFDILHPIVPETLQTPYLSNDSDSALNQDNHSAFSRALALCPASDAQSRGEDNPSLQPLNLSEHSKDNSPEHTIASVASHSVNDRLPVPGIIVSPSFPACPLPPPLLHSFTQTGLHLLREAPGLDLTPLLRPPTHTAPPVHAPYSGAYPCLFRVVEDVVRIMECMLQLLSGSRAPLTERIYVQP
ncbi:hypothetical protein V8D89_001175 [Ganoderma adspersum]